MTDPNDNQGRGESPQLPECYGIVWAAIVGVCCWFAVLIVTNASRSVL